MFGSVAERQWIAVAELGGDFSAVLYSTQQKVLNT